MTFRAFEAARVLTGNVVGVLFWFTAWLLNAYFTIVSVTDFGNTLTAGTRRKPRDFRPRG